MLDFTRERDPEILRAACGAYEKANRQLVEKIRELTQRLADLGGLDAAQAGLDLPDVHFKLSEAPRPLLPCGDAKKPGEKERVPAPGHGPTPQPNIPTEACHHVFDGPPDCPSCGGAMQLWEGQCEESEEITVVERSFRLLLHRRQKYRCRCNGSVLTAPGPDKLIPGGRYSVDFAVSSVISKFCDHNPLERQTRQMERQGLVVSSQALWDQHDALASHLEATWRKLCESVLEQPVLNVDETGWRMMEADAESKWSLFGLTSPKLAAYHLVGSKSAATARRILTGFRGKLVVDGFAIYPIVAELEKSIEIAHCWAHVDRKFKDAKDPPDRIAEIRTLIHQLYELEREVAGPFPGPPHAQAERQRIRQEKSQPILKAIQQWCYAQGGLRRSAFGKAVRYLLKHWKGLEVFLTDPRVPLDNNAAERALRGPVVGRKNFYGNRSKRGAKVAAIFYSVIETAKLNGIDPAAYLKRAAVAAIRSPGTATLPR